MNMNKNGLPFPHDPSRKGYTVLYYNNQVNRCPGCHGSQWIIGRLTAECAYERCGVVLPLETPGTAGDGLFTRITPKDRARIAQAAEFEYAA